MKSIGLGAAVPLVVFSLLYVLAVRPQRLAAASAEQRAHTAVPSAITNALDEAGIRGLTAMNVANGPAGTMAPLEVTFHATIPDVFRLLHRLDALPAEIRALEIAFENGPRSLRVRLRLAYRM